MGSYDESIFYQQIEEAKELVKRNAKFTEKYGKDLYYNNYYRALFQKEVLINFFDLPEEDIRLDPKGNTGPDFNSIMLEIFNGEMKVQWHKPKNLTPKNLGMCRFDKQNDEMRRRAIYDYDALMYSSMRRNGRIVFSLLILGQENMKHIHPLFKKEQDAKIQEIELCQQKSKRLSRDDIAIRVYDIIKLLNDTNMIIILDGNKTNKVNFLELIGDK